MLEYPFFNCVTELFTQKGQSCIHVGFVVNAEGTRRTLLIVVFERKLYVTIIDNHLAIIIGLFRVETLKSQ